ncbi:hypothetical protein B0H10DRAFT_2208221 [Mycena sp. CBHHK59/15]|nr:hypothetical protein B0H10DRAFT_2208221 [Mycena sp. CBHHK59/15]
MHEASSAEHPATCTTSPHTLYCTLSSSPLALTSVLSSPNGRVLSMETHIQLGEPSTGTISPVLTSTMYTILDELSTCNTQITPCASAHSMDYTPVATHRNLLGIVEPCRRIVQRIEQGFSVSGELNLDLEYAINLITAL